MKKTFLTGLILFLPVVLTISIVVWSINLITVPFLNMVETFFIYIGFDHIGTWNLSDEALKIICQFIILIGLVFLIVLIGYIIRNFLIDYIFKLMEKILKKIPFISAVYKTVQDVAKTLLGNDKKSFQQVVVVPFSHPDIHCLGLVTKPSPDTCQQESGEDLISVFIPSTPNPTTGFVVMYPKKDLVYLKMQPEEAIKFIVTLGVMQPKEQEV
jgi:uncharacterized membrane protein